MKKILLYSLSVVLFAFSATALAEPVESLAAFEAAEYAEVSVLVEPADEAVSHVERLRTAHSVDSVDIQGALAGGAGLSTSEHSLMTGYRGDSPILRYDKAAA